MIGVPFFLSPKGCVLCALGCGVVWFGVAWRGVAHSSAVFTDLAQLISTGVTPRECCGWRLDGVAAAACAQTP